MAQRLMVAVTKHSQGHVEIIVYLGFDVKICITDDYHHVGDDEFVFFGYLLFVREKDGAIGGKIGLKEAVYEGDYRLRAGFLQQTLEDDVKEVGDFPLGGIAHGL
jgi:hypothetical protein